MRATIEKNKVKTIKEKKESNLRQLAQKAREERAGIRREDATGIDVSLSNYFTITFTSKWPYLH